MTTAVSHIAPAGTHQIVLILDDDVMITEGLAAGLAREGRTIITCNDVESAEIVVDWLKPSHVVSDIRLTGDFGFEGLDFIRVVKRQSPDTRSILMTGDAPERLQLEGSERGAVGFLQKPFEVAALDSLLNLMAPERTGSPDWPDIIRIPTLDEILSDGRLGVAFQPIVRIETGQRVGFEALARYESESPFRNPETLFRYAIRKHRVTDLEFACIRTTLTAGTELARCGPLFLNVHPEVFASGALVEAVTERAEAYGVALNRIVLEITEQASLRDDSRVFDAIARLKAAGVRLAFDDVGIAYSHLPFLGKVAPAFLKISQHFGTAFETDTTKLRIVRNLRSLAKDFDSELIIEGIESAATADAARELGIRYAQGFYFALPSQAKTFVEC